MKKRKSRILSFSILALCLACLAFGVYALKNATLTVNGTVGFTAHDCMVKVDAYIKGDGLTLGGETATDGHPSEERALNFRNANSNTITVGGASELEWNKTDEFTDVIYFTDLTDDGTVAPITITFKLTNLSVYDVYATIANVTDLEAKGVSVVTSQQVLMQETNDSNTDEAVLTAVFTLDTTKVTDAGLMEGFELKLDFGKYVEVENGGEEGGEESSEIVDITKTLPQNEEELRALFNDPAYQIHNETGDPDMPETAQQVFLVYKEDNDASTPDLFYGYAFFANQKDAEDYRDYLEENKSDLSLLNIGHDRITVAFNYYD